MKPVIQRETTGCGIACAAAIAGISYAKAKKIANGLGIYAKDEALWSDTALVRRLLAELGITAEAREIPFSSWQSLPDCALLSIKWRLKQGVPNWHWVVFIRENGTGYVLDSNKALTTPVRTDFWRMKPRWYIAITT